MIVANAKIATKYPIIIAILYHSLGVYEDYPNPPVYEDDWDHGVSM
jgi:hypothetical protein